MTKALCFSKIAFNLLTSIPSQLSEYILVGGVKQNSQNFSCEWLTKEAKKGVAKEFIKYSSERIAREREIFLAKRFLNLSSKAPLDIFESPYGPNYFFDSPVLGEKVYGRPIPLKISIFIPTFKIVKLAENRS